jgi:PAS domain S-box-containing protein
MGEGEIDRPVASGQYAERRRGERRMGGGRRAAEGPRESPSTLRELVELAPDAVVVVDADRHVTDANAAACALYGYSREELLGRTLADLAPEEADTERRRAERERDEALKFMGSVLEQAPVGLAVVRGPRGDQAEFNECAQHMLGRPSTARIDPADTEIRTLDGRRLERDQLPATRALRGERGVRAEFLVRNAKGSSTPIALSAGPVVGPDGSVLAAVAVFEDITAAKELERLREEWSGVVAHDLRQPLGTISLSAQILARATDEAKLLKYADQIHAAAQRLDRMVGDLMDLSRLDARRLELVRQRVDVPALVSAVSERVALQAPDRAIDVRILGQVPDVEADPDRIAQVMENLLTNAVKYGKGGTTILTSVSWEDGDVAVAVTNEGRPLTAEELSRIFERFHRTASAKLEGIQGVGLGLYITRSLVEAHGGRITAESTPAGLTRFRFTLPVARTPDR